MRRGLVDWRFGDFSIGLVLLLIVLFSFCYLIFWISFYFICNRGGWKEGVLRFIFILFKRILDVYRMYIFRKKRFFWKEVFLRNLLIKV